MNVPDRGKRLNRNNIGLWTSRIRNAARKLIGCANHEREDKQPLTSRPLLVVSMYKSGTHLIRRILESAGQFGRHVGWEYKLDDIKNCEENGFIITHYAPREIPIIEAIQSKAIKVIFHYRDPRDVCASAFRWLHPDNQKVDTLGREFLKEVNRNYYQQDDDFLEAIIRGDMLSPTATPIAKLFRQSRSLLFHPYVHKTRFEDMVGKEGGGCRSKQLEAIQGVLDFIEIQEDAGEIARSAFCPDSKTFNKGQIGSYLESFSPSHIKIFNELHCDILKDYGYG